MASENCTDWLPGINKGYQVYEFSSAWDLRGSLQDLWLYYLMGQELANSKLWPNWVEGKEFKAARDQSRASIKE